MMYAQTEIAALQSVNATIAMDALDEELHGVQSELQLMMDNLQQASSLRDFALLVLALRPWVEQNPIMACHLGEKVEQLAHTVAEFQSCKADYLDLQVVCESIRARLHECSVIFAIEQELIDSVWRVN